MFRPGSGVVQISFRPLRQDRGMKPTVLYIAGLGRSGSTLLADILNSVPGVVSVGELPTFWQHGWRDDWRCNDGTRFSSAPVWQAVLRDWALTHPDLPPDRALALANRVWRRRHGLAALSRCPPRHWPKDLRLYRGMFETIYGSLAQHTGARVLVDSGKVPFHAALLAGSDRVAFRLLRLTRDPRAVSHSRRRHKRNLNTGGAGTDWMMRQSGLRLGLRWVWTDLQMRMIQTQTPVLTLRYEDLVADPHRAVLPLLRSLDLSPSQGFLADLAARQYCRVPSIAFAGNPDRFRLGQVAIAADDAWRSAPKTAHHLCADLVTRPFRPRRDPLGSTHARPNARSSAPGNHPAKG